MEERKKYRYCGVVKEFNEVISSRWSGETMATSEKKARCNLVYQYKKEHGKTSDVKITLPGTLVIVE